MSGVRLHVPVLVIGSGLAGCTAALTLADSGHDVLLIHADPAIDDGNSALAQGGIIYQARTSADSRNPSEKSSDASALAADILVAGHRYNNRKAVSWLCEQGPRCVEEILIKRVQVNFDKDARGELHLTREGGHGVPRILHVADYSGKAIMDALAAKVAAHPRITVRKQHSAIDLLTAHHHARGSQFRYEVRNRCLGAYVLDEQKGEPLTILADWTILATGGVGQVFLHSTNASCAVGSGISMAFRAGVALENLEFMQFHPTALYEKHSLRRPLITEAMRGEGARLVDRKGKPFMLAHDPRGDLAPRDVVAQAMLAEMQRSGAPCLFLDVKGIKEDLPSRFPTVYSQCREIGLDLPNDPIPVVPAAHYFCGGILTDKHGRTSLQGLYAIGETACTGLHGANRLASTSLLEALVWGVSSGQDIARNLNSRRGISTALAKAIPDWHHDGGDERDDPALVAQDWANIRHTMWNYVGISRTSARLRRAFEDLRDLVRHIHDFYKHTPISRRLIDLFHGAQTAYVVTQAAMRNQDSLGCHHRQA